MYQESKDWKTENRKDNIFLSDCYTFTSPLSWPSILHLQWIKAEAKYSIYGQEKGESYAVLRTQNICDRPGLPDLPLLTPRILLPVKYVRTTEKLYKRKHRIWFICKFQLSNLCLYVSKTIYMFYCSTCLLPEDVVKSAKFWMYCPFDSRSWE